MSMSNQKAVVRARPMGRAVRSLAFSLMAFAGLALPTLAPAGRVMAEELPSDPRVVSGKLPNGLEYRVMQHAKPPGRVSIYMHVSSGSLNETDKQRGIAHYLEHMAFNGSENFKPGTVVDFFQALGLSFGQHQNAFTSFDQTTYILAMPDNQPETLDKGLKFFSDVNQRLLLQPDEIENERQVILEERRTRLGGQQRVQEHLLKNLAPGSTFGERLPIGVEETIKGVTKQDFLDYWTTYYTPSNTTVMIVGDMDPKVMVERITTAFGEFPTKPRPQDKPVGVQKATEPRGVFASDKELTRAALTIQLVSPPEPPTTTRAAYRKDLVELIGMLAFNRRLDDKVKAGSVAFQNAGAGAGNQVDALRVASIRFGGESGKWREMLTDMGKEFARARKFGFTSDEIEIVRKELMASAEQEVETESGRDARQILGEMNNSVASREPMLSAHQQLEVVASLLPSITAEECSKAFKDAFDGPLQYTLTLPDNVPGPGSEPELASLGEAAVNVEVKPEAAVAKADTLMEKEPTPGTIAEGALHEASQVWSGWLSNGVRVHHRYMDYQENAAMVVISVLGGELTENEKNHGISEVAGLAFGRSAATKHLSSSDIRDLMAGTKVRVMGGGGGEGFRMMVMGTPDDLEKGLQLAHLLLTEPKIEKAAFDQWKTRTLQGIESEDKDVDAYFRRLGAKTIFPANEVRTQPLTKAEVEALKLDDAQAWLEQQLAKNPIEVVVVGDAKREETLQLVAKYLGSLASRERVSSNTFAALRNLPAPRGKSAHEQIVTDTDKARVSVGFFGPNETDTLERRCMQLAARVISTRMLKKIREEEQLVYSISAGFTPGTLYKGYGMLTASSSTDPTKVDALVARCKEMFLEFAKTGPTTEELDQAKKQIDNTLDEQMKLPQFWMGSMDGLTFRGRNIQDVVDAPTAYPQITREQVLKVYQRYCKPDMIVEIAVSPKTGGASSQGAAKPAAVESK